MSKNYLTFIKRPITDKKTLVFAVYNDDIYLGAIAWHFPWRTYVFYPEESTFWSPDCMKEVIHFIEKLMKERKGGK